MILDLVHINLYSILGGSCVWNLLQCDHRLEIQLGGTYIYLLPSLPVERQAQSQLLLNRGCVAWLLQGWGVQTACLIQDIMSASSCRPIASFLHEHTNELFLLLKYQISFIGRDLFGRVSWWTIDQWARLSWLTISFSMASTKANLSSCFIAFRHLNISLKLMSVA